jgi:hypothetical protein
MSDSDSGSDLDLDAVTGPGWSAPPSKEVKRQQTIKRVRFTFEFTNSNAETCCDLLFTKQC